MHLKIFLLAALGLALVTAPVSAANWDAGTYKGTSSDTNDNSGQLGIGYLDGSNPAAGSLTNELKGYWRMDKTSSGNVIDYSGNGIDGTNDGAARGASGIFSTNSFSFDGTDDHVTAGTTSYWNSEISGPFTVSVWVYMRDKTRNTFINRGNPWEGGDPDGDDGPFTLHYNVGGDNQVRFGVVPDDGDNYPYEHVPGSDMPTDQWVHLVGVADGSSLTIYQDGTVDNSEPISATPHTDNTEDTLDIGAHEEGDSNFCNCKIDEVMIWDRALSANEVKKLYFRGSDGQYNANYTYTINKGSTVSWDKLNVNMDSIPANTNLNAIATSIDSSGNRDSQAFVLRVGGVDGTNYSLNVDNSDELELVFKGTSSDSAASWLINDFKLYTSSPGGAGPVGPGFKRAVTEFDYKYSALILSTGSQQIVPFRVYNPDSAAKTIELDISPSAGLDAVFVDGSSPKTLNVPPGEERSALIKVSSSTSGEKILNVSATNTDLGLTTKSSIPVFVKKSSETRLTRDVPGIGFLQLLSLVFVSLIFYSASL